jgi:hypothetical protein
MSESLATQGRRFVDLKDKRDQLKIEFEAAEKKFRDAEAAFWQAIDASEQKSAHFDLGPGYGEVQFTRRETITSTVLNPEEAAKALEEAGLADAILGSPAVRKKVLNEYVRDWIKSGQPMPKGIDFHARRYLTTTKKKGKT